MRTARTPSPPLAAALLLAAGLMAGPGAARQPGAVDHGAIAARAVDGHILPGWTALTAATAGLAQAASAGCAPGAQAAAVEAAYHAAFDAWMGVGHLRFGPAEWGDRGFAIAFWPDARAAGPRALTGMLSAPQSTGAAALAMAPVAARGLLALDWLLGDEQAAAADPARRCALIAAVAADLATTAAAVEADWRGGYADRLRRAGAPGETVYPSAEEGTRRLYAALSGGVEATADLRVGRPLGTEQAPQPRRAEAWRTGRPLRNVALALAALEAFSGAFATEVPPDAAARLAAAFAAARAAADAVTPPLSEAVADPARRPAVVALRAALEALRSSLAADLAAPLGLTLGFNALDGD